jgi:hypothetical protein
VDITGCVATTFHFKTIMTKRLFTFGCSFTRYIWPTWADILSLNYDVSQNWGKVGAGNHFILYSLVESIQRNKICKNDTVAIMFTSVAREDRWVRGKWLTPGSVYHSSLDSEYIKNFTDPDGFVITNNAVIESIVRILQGIGCEYHLMSTIPIKTIDDSCLKKMLLLDNKIQKQIEIIYSDSLKQIKPSVYEVIFKCDFDSRNHILIPVAKKSGIKIFKKQYQACIGKNWPSFEEFMLDKLDNVDSDVVREIDKQFDFFSWRDRLNTKRQDPHPTPLEHYEYLDKQGFNLSKEQKDFAEKWNYTVLNCEQIGWNVNSVKRF